MQFNKSTLLAIAVSAQFALAAYVPSQPWTTLKPTASYPSGAITDYPSTFGVAVSRVGSATVSGSSTGLAKRGLVKRDVATQITDGQVQATTGTKKSTKAAATQITDGQVQATTGTAKATKAAATQITDGQVQATTGTEKSTKAAATQIGDGQVQATTGTAKSTKAAATQIGDGQVQATTGTAKATKAAVSQIGDGQIQETTGTAKATKAAVSQIGDGQIQATTGTAKATKAAVSQIGDGQVQATTAPAKTTKGAASQIGDGQVQATTGSTATKAAASQITDGQVQATGSSTPESNDGQVTDAKGDSITDPVDSVSCYSDDTLALTLKDSVLEDAHSRIGSIVANHQFQFDGPTPQAGAIYAAGWSITSDGLLAIGDNTKFFECLSGTFYNLYDEDIGSVCYEIVLQVVDLVSC